MITGVNHIDNAPAPLSVAGAGFTRPDDEHPGNSHEEVAALEQEQKEAGEHGRGDGESSVPEGRGGAPPPDDPGLVMARPLAGDGKTDESLGRLLEDLDGINSGGPEDQAPRASAPPVAPFAHAKSNENPHHRAASAYKWGHQALNAKNPLMPGVIYSEEF
ncbi:MAG: hypothetical protein O7F14_09970 [Alphaproteobacteria bacterium]|nr:hypothetical protein [Alphaproteobacteria bacterium]